MYAEARGKSLSDRIIGAFTFRREVYADVEKDTSFTGTAWLIVVVVSFLRDLGGQAQVLAERGAVSWILAALVAAVVSVIAFAIGALIINWVARTVFKANVTFEELVRTLGLAYVWNIVGIVGVVGAFSSGLACLLGPGQFVLGILGLVSWFIAAKEALDLDWVQTIVTVILGWLAGLVIIAITATVLALLGLGAAAVGGALNPGG
jgi:hypothetical protein